MTFTTFQNGLEMWWHIGLKWHLPMRITGRSGTWRVQRAVASVWTLPSLPVTGVLSGPRRHLQSEQLLTSMVTRARRWWQRKFLSFTEFRCLCFKSWWGMGSPSFYSPQRVRKGAVYWKWCLMEVGQSGGERLQEFTSADFCASFLIFRFRLTRL